MEERELKPKPGDDDQSSNPGKGDDSDSSEDFSLFDDAESAEDKQAKEEEFLANLEKVTGKKFKSIAAYRKSVKEADRHFANEGRNKPQENKPVETTPQREPESPKVPTWAAALYKQNNPEYALVEKKVDKIAKDLKRDPFEVYEDETYSFLKAEAKSLYEEQNTDEEGKQKVKNPSSPSFGKGDGKRLKLSDADRALLRIHGKTEKDVKF